MKLYNKMVTRSEVIVTREILRSYMIENELVTIISLRKSRAGLRKALR